MPNLSFVPGTRMHSSSNQETRREVPALLRSSVIHSSPPPNLEPRFEADGEILLGIRWGTLLPPYQVRGGGVSSMGGGVDCGMVGTGGAFRNLIKASTINVIVIKRMPIPRSGR